MKYLLLLCLFCTTNSAIAQSISVGTISKPILCVGDTVWVPYTSHGSFQADNFFAAQLSDAGGSFTTFTNIGHFIKAVDSIPVVIGNAGDHFRVRVIGTDSYTVSSNTSTNISVLNYPSPRPAPDVKATSFGYVAFVGDVIQFSDGTSEPLGSKYLWSFDQDASILWTTDSVTSLTYSSQGMKSGRLSVTNTAGCSSLRPFNLIILSCKPVIPDSAHIVTGTEFGSFSFVWVKAGGDYTVDPKPFGNGDASTTVFAEPGASVHTNSRSLGFYYLKTGASFSWDYSSNALVILNDGNSISFKDILHYIDTLYCTDLQFDYSQVNGSKGVKIAENPLQIINISNGLRVQNQGANISVDVVDLLGNKMFSKSSRDELSLDLSNLTNGVYFALITSSDQREIKKIVVMH